MANKIKGCGLVLLICLGLFGGCKSPGERQETLTPEQQKQRLLKRINRRFEDPKAHLELGRLYQEEGRLDDAIFHYKTVLSLDPVSWSAQAALVKALVQKGRSSEAEQTAKIYINQVSTSAKRLLKLGKAFQEQGLDKYALACYHQALRLAPDSPLVYKQLGYFYLAKGDNVRTSEYFKRSFELDWNQPDIAYELGKLGTRIEVPRQAEPENTSAGKSNAQPAKKSSPKQ